MAKSKKRRSSQKKRPPTAKPRVRKDLNADALIRLVRKRFVGVKDHRKRKCRISVSDALMSAFAMFSLKDSSLLAFEARRKDAGQASNLKSVYGVENIPSDTHMRSTLDEVDPYESIAPVFTDVFRVIQRGGGLDRMRLFNDHYLLNTDGTGRFSSGKLGADCCLKKKSRKSGETIYQIQTVVGAFCHPDRKEVIPLSPEHIRNDDGDTKNDCERNATRRFLEQVRKDHPHLKMVVNEDGLAANAPHIEDLQRLGFEYLIVVKPGDHKFLYEYVGYAVQEGEADEFVIPDEKDPGKRHRFRILHNVPLNASNQHILVNFIEYWEEYDDPNKQGYHNAWITSLPVPRRHAIEIMRMGRARWRIENETFNTLKNQGYHYTHNYGLGNKHLSLVFGHLMMLAFLVDQALQLCCPLFQAVWKKLGSKKALWERIRSVYYHFELDSMRTLYEAILYGIRFEPPRILRPNSA